MDAFGFLTYFGVPTIFLLLSMSAVGWLSHKRNWKLTQRARVWFTTWPSIGFLIVLVLVTAAWIMNTNFVYNNASLVWPFCMTIEALDGHPPILVGLLVLAELCVINGVFYALLATISWFLLKALRPRGPAA
jgi:lysylphosphatidylglycerol synthetase-like protein (DUF2156 family)